MTKPTCATCPFWDATDRSKSDGANCRENPGAIVVQPVHDGYGGYIYEQHPVLPYKGRDEWCSKHPDFPKWMEKERG